MLPFAFKATNEQSLRLCLRPVFLSRTLVLRASETLPCRYIVDEDLQGLIIFHAFGFLWGQNFILAVGNLAIAGATAGYKSHAQLIQWSMSMSFASLAILGN